MKRKLATEQVKYATEKEAHEALKEEYMQKLAKEKEAYKLLEEEHLILLKEQKESAKEKESLERQLQSCREQLDTLQLRDIQGTCQMPHTPQCIISWYILDLLCTFLPIPGVYSPICLTMHA